MRELLRKCGVDRVIAYTVVGRSWTFISGPISLLLIVRFLTSEEQGFYYTFGNVLGLYVLFELGLSFVIFQFASHEKAKLEWTKEGTLDGDPIAKERLFSLLRKAMVWYAGLAALVLAVLIPSGIVFFNGYNRSSDHRFVAWQVPWIWVVTVTACDLLSAPIVAGLEGGGLFTEIALVRTAQAIAGGVLTWLALALHGRLFAAPVSNTVVVAIWWGWLFCTKRPFLRQLFSYVGTLGRGVVWRTEVWPFQWRIALSGISSYFIFLIWTPVLFRYQGATVAGQLGMSATVLAAITTIAVSWVSTKMSPFGSLIAEREFVRLDALFFPAMIKSVAVFCALGIGVLACVYGLDAEKVALGRRLLPLVPFALLAATFLVNHIVGLEALYLRAHKQEPFLALSVVVAILIASSTYYFGRYFSAMAMIEGNLLVTLLFSLGWGTYIFWRKRAEWHNDAAHLAEPVLIEQCAKSS